MEWRLRHNNDDVPAGKNAPNYGSNSELFTIRMHHSGKLCNLGEQIYVGGSIAHIDYCEQDRISMLEVKRMAEEIGLDYSDCSLSGPNRCYTTKVMKTDKDAMDLVYHLDEERIVGIFCQQVVFSSDEEEEETVLPDLTDILKWVVFIKCIKMMILRMLMKSLKLMLLQKKRKMI